MNLDFIFNFTEPVIIGICLCVGYVIKSSLDFLPNKYIPLIMAILGLVINILISKGISGDIALVGLFSGLSSTGLHQAFKNLLQKECESENK